MFKRALMTLALVGMVASPALADLLVPDQAINPAHLAGVGTIGVAGASVNGIPLANPGFIGAGGVASQVSIPVNPSDTIMVTFAFHWPFQALNYYPVPYMGVQFQNKLVYDNTEVQVVGATGAGVFSAVNFGGAGTLLGGVIPLSKMRANGPSTTTTIGGGTVMNPGSATMTGPGGTFLKGFPNPSSGIISTAPGFGRFAVNPPTTITAPFMTTMGNLPSASAGGMTTDMGMILPFSSTFPIMKVTLHVKSAFKDNQVDLFIPPTSAFALIRVMSANTSMFTGPFGTVTTMTNTFIKFPGLYYTGSNVGVVGGDFGVEVVPEPASAALMGIGLFSLVGGFWRRRRRMSR